MRRTRKDGSKRKKKRVGYGTPPKRRQKGLFQWEKGAEKWEKGDSTPKTETSRIGHKLA